MTSSRPRLSVVTAPGQAGIAAPMEREPQPMPAEEVVGKDELDEDDEMILAGEELVEEPSDRCSAGVGQTSPKGQGRTNR